jgi:ElaB/YqjD/DUF883 family membrane-anchored ribosome-binding protein
MSEATEIRDQMDSPNTRKAAAGAVDQVIATGREVQNAAVDLANSSAEAIKGHASDALEAAKGVAAQAGDRLQDKLSEQKGAGADYVNTLADTMRRAAGEFDSDIPIAGSYIRKAADRVDDAADALRTGNFNDLVSGAQAFARSQPTAFLGLAVLAGFGAVRFLKSSSAMASSGGSSEANPDPSATRPAYRPTNANV